MTDNISLRGDARRPGVGASRVRWTVYTVLIVGLITLLILVLPPIREVLSTSSLTQSVTTPVCGTWAATTRSDLEPGAYRAIAAISNDDIWVAGGYSGPLFAHWDGRKLNSVSSPPVEAGDFSITTIDASSHNDVWALGHYTNKQDSVTAKRNEDLLFHWDGSQWRTVSDLRVPEPVMQNKGDSIYLNDLVTLSKKDVWLVGAFQQDGTDRTLTEHWDGAQWKIVPSPNVNDHDNPLAQVAAVSANDVWALGYYDSEPGDESDLLIHWDGSQWRVEDASHIIGVTDKMTGDHNFSDMVAVKSDPSDAIWVVGSKNVLREAKDRDRSTLVARWFSQAWSIVPSPDHPNTQGYRFVGNSLYESVAVSSKDVWAIGQRWDDVSTSRSFALHWDGTTWAEVPGPRFPDGEHLFGVTATPGGDVWIVGDSLKEGDDSWSSDRTVLAHFVRCK